MNRTILATGVLVMFLGCKSQVVGLDFDEQHITDEKLLLEKQELMKTLSVAKRIDPKNYTKSSYKKLESTIEEAEAMIEALNICKKNIQLQKRKVQRNIKKLNSINLIELEHEKNNIYIIFSEDI